MKDYRVTVKVRNNRILKAIEEVGGETGLKWCKLHGMQYGHINDFINMTLSPLDSEGRLRINAARLCDAVNKLPEDLWSNEQLYPLEKNFSEMEMDHEQVLALTGEQSYLPDFSDFENRQLKNLLGDALATLSGREEMVLRMRFEDGFTLDEIGDRIGVQKERVRQIEAKALSKMRHPSRVGMFVDGVDAEIVSDERRMNFKKKARACKREGGKKRNIC